MSRARILTAAALVAAGVVAAPLPARADRAVARAMVEDGHRLAQAGRGEAALGHYERAMAEDPDYLPAYDAAIDVWLGARRFRELFVHLGNVTLRHPQYANGWYALGFAYRLTARYDLAVLCYRAYIELRPHEPDPHFGLAMAHLELGDRDQAVAAFERYVAIEDRPERVDYVRQARAELERAGAPTGWSAVMRRVFAPVVGLARRAGSALDGDGRRR